MAKRKLSTFERLQRGERLLRRERRELQRQLESCDAELKMVHPDAAGIDVGNASHFVSVPAGRDPEPYASSDPGRRICIRRPIG